jgi:diaminopimelate decarboxylase
VCEVDILLRFNLASDPSGVALAMSGPFGKDPGLIELCTPSASALSGAPDRESRHSSEA